MSKTIGGQVEGTLKEKMALNVCDLKCICIYMELSKKGPYLFY